MQFNHRNLRVELETGNLKDYILSRLTIVYNAMPGNREMLSWNSTN